MKRIIIVLGLIIVAATVSHSYGATFIESRNGQGEGQKIWIEGNKMRVESGSGQSYLLLDTENKKMSVVDPAEKTIMDMSNILQRKFESQRRGSR